MYGIIGEDRSDVETLKVIVKRLAVDEHLPVKIKGYGGCGELLRKGAKQLKAFADLGCTKLIACYDADGPDFRQRFHQLMESVVNASGVQEKCCAVIQLHELEAWIIAYIGAVTNVFSSWNTNPITSAPESVPNPKEFLESLSRAENKKPRYSHAVHNEKIALHLDLQRVYDRCPSFRGLAGFVRT